MIQPRGSIWHQVQGTLKTRNQPTRRQGRQQRPRQRNDQETDSGTDDDEDDPVVMTNRRQLQQQSSGRHDNNGSRRREAGSSVTVALIRDDWLPESGPSLILVLCLVVRSVVLTQTAVTKCGRLADSRSPVSSTFVYIQMQTAKQLGCY